MSTNIQTKTRVQNLNGKTNLGKTITSPGIYTNCEVNVDYVTNTSKTGNKYEAIKIDVTTEDGESKSFQVIRPTKGYPREVTVDGNTYMESEADALLRAEDSTLEYLLTLVKCVDGNNLDNITSNDYAQIAKDLVLQFNVNNTKYSPTFNVKLVMSKKSNYVELAKYGVFELYREGKDCKLKIGKYDYMGDTPEQSTDSLTMSNSSVNTSDDLPF